MPGGLSIWPFRELALPSATIAKVSEFVASYNAVHVHLAIPAHKAMPGAKVSEFVASYNAVHVHLAIPAHKAMPGGLSI